MMSRVIIAIEILSMVVCLYNVFGEKLKLNFSFLSVVLSLVAIQELMNYYHINGIGTILIYIVLFIFSKRKFKETAVGTGVRLLLQLIFMVGLQFICLVAVNFFLSGDEKEVSRTFVSIIVVLLCNLFIQFKIDLTREWKTALTVNLSIFLTGGFLLFIILAVLLSSKLQTGVSGEIYIISLPFIIFTILWMVKWAASQNKLKEKEKAVEQAHMGEDDFRELLLSIRLRQHEFKNHLSAILSAQYTHKTYEKLVKAQNEYWGHIKEENKYYNLLMIANQQLAGFLYGKLQWMEEYGIAIECVVKTQLKALPVPAYHMIELLGIFMDNAKEALETLEKRRFFLGISQKGEYYYFQLRNVFPYVDYEERVRWFGRGVSHKGEGRGLGLYHARQLCEKWNCSIQCENLELEEENWIEFCIEVKKADNP